MACDPSTGAQAGWYFAFLGIVAATFVLPIFLIRKERQIEVLGLTVPYVGSLQYLWGNALRLGNRFYSEPITDLRNLNYSNLRAVGRLFALQWTILYAVISSSLWLVWRELCWIEGAPALALILTSTVLAALFTPAYNIWFWEQWHIAFILNALSLLSAVAGTVLGALKIDAFAALIALMCVYMGALTLSLWSQLFQPYAALQYLEQYIEFPNSTYITMVGRSWLAESPMPQEKRFTLDALNQFEWNDPGIPVADTMYDTDQEEDINL